MNHRTWGGWVGAFTAALLGMVAAPAALHAQHDLTGCLDRQQRPVELRVKNDMGWGGLATIVDGKPVIYWNKHLMDRANRPMQIFVYFHECAHHVLGHVWTGESPRAEREADCWAIQLMVESGMIRGGHVAMIERELRHSRGDANHLGGEELIQSLAACIDIKTDKNAWKLALDSLDAASANDFADAQGVAVPYPSAQTGVYESKIDLPGTYDCEITRSRAVHCMIFAARDQKRADKRFHEIEKIIRDWLPQTWTAVTHSGGGADITRNMLAEDGLTGAGIVLAESNRHRVYFEFRSPNTAGLAASSAPTPNSR